MAKATKAARERANVLGVSIDDIEGTGHGGQVTAGDVEKHQKDSDEAHAEVEPQEGIVLNSEAPFPKEEAQKNIDSLYRAKEDAELQRARSTTTQADLQDARLNAQLFVEEQQAPVENLPDPVVSRSSIADSPDLHKESNVAEDQKVRLAFNAASGTNSLVTEHGSFSAGDEVDGATFNYLKTLKTDGTLIVDEENSAFVDEHSENSAEEEQANAANLKADGNESEESDERGPDAQSETASADEQKED